MAEYDFYKGVRIYEDKRVSANRVYAIPDYTSSFFNIDRSVADGSLSNWRGSNNDPLTLEGVNRAYNELLGYVRYSETEQQKQHRLCENYKKSRIAPNHCRPLPYPEPSWIVAERLAQSKNTDLTQFDVIEPYEKDKTE